MSPPNRPRPTVPPSASTDDSRTDGRLSRRTFVAAGSATALASLAGCSAVVDFLADMALQEVNVFNGADRPISGSIEIADPDAEVVLEASFVLEEEPEDGEEADEENPALAQYDDVWTDEGEYEVSLALDDPLDVESADAGAPAGNESDDANESDEPASDGETAPDGEDAQHGSSETDAVTIDDTEEQKLVIGIGQEESDDPISYHVIEDFSDLEDEFEE